MKRAIVIVLDSFGIGAMPDAKEFFDDCPDTAGNIYRACGKLDLPNLYKLGLSHIDGISLPKTSNNALASYARLFEKSHGKDTITGHWELMGIVSKNGFSIYPNGFPQSFMDVVERVWNVKTLGNMPASGTEIIKKLGAIHAATGAPIVYTSADSVFQVAAHEDVIPLDRLYKMCETVRELLDKYNMGVGRVIARPFTGDEASGFVRTENRRDFSVIPPCDTILDMMCKDGIETLGIGKISDIFAGRGIVHDDHTKNNVDGINAIISHMKSREAQFIFANLVDFDMLYGHRRDPYGYKAALEYFDMRLPEILGEMSSEDLLMITADHGCDPTAKGTDHTRDYVPLLIRCKGCGGVNLGTIEGFDFVGKMAYKWLKSKGNCNELIE